MRKHFFNEEFFDCVDSEEKAYWLGFIVADGHVSSRHRAIEIGLAVKDEAHLRLFCKAVGYDGELQPKNNGKACVLRLYSFHMYNSLTGIHQITSNKTFDCKPINNLPDDLLTAFWRGVFDGDGCFCKYGRVLKSGRVRTEWSASFVGTLDMVIGLQNYLSQVSGVTVKGTVTQIGGVYRLMMSGWKPAQIVASVLYQSANVVLARKQNLAKELLSISEPAPIISHYTAKELIPMKEKHLSWERVAQELGVSRNGLYKHVRKLKIPLEPRKKWKRQATSC